MAKEVRVRVPASSANLGPGFDTLALALGLYLRCTLRETGGRLRVRAGGTEPRGIPEDESNLVWRTFRRLAGERCGHGFELEIENDIPLGRGLGSSAAAIVAGLVLADAWTGTGRGKPKLIDIATGLEGHPDNVSAAALGGLVVSCQAEDGSVLAIRSEFPQTMHVIVVAPEFELATESARAALPAQYSRRDAVFNVQRAALLVAALQSGCTSALREAMRDRLHQGYRAPLIPGLNDALSLRDLPGLLGVALSGAGPSVIAFCEGDSSAAGDALAECFHKRGIGARAMPLAVDAEGAVASSGE